MATAEELLNTISQNQVSVLSEDDGIFAIDSESRTITVPDSERLFGVKGDKDVERKYFQCPKIVGDNIDLSQHQIYVSYVFTTTENNTSFPDESTGLYHCDDVETSGDNITFSWLLSGNVFANPGFIAFKVMAKKSEGGELKTKWNTAPAIGTVLLTVPDGEEIAEEYPDIINQLLTKMESVEQIATPEAMQGYVNAYLEENPVTGGMTEEQEQQLNQNTTDVADLKSALEQIEDDGWSSTQIDLFEAFTNVIAYTSPDANSIVSSLISSLRSGSSDTPEGSFSIIYVLSNVTSSSKDNSIKSGEPYNTTLTANPGYELESVIVKMGGSDITSTAYSDGEITISAVTGNIVITASAVQSSASGQLPQDGLVDYFDFRNKTYTAGSGGLYYINSDFGNGMLYSWYNQLGKQGDNIGLKGATGNYTTERATGYPVTDNFPSTRTVCLFGKGGPSVPHSIGMDGTLSNSFLYIIKYRATDKTTKIFPNEQIQYPEGFNKNGYNASFVIVNQNILKVYFNDTLHKTVDGNEIEDFESWDITPLGLTSFNNYGTAYAIYNKELSEVEIVEALEFFKTLEVSE